MDLQSIYHAYSPRLNISVTRLEIVSLSFFFFFSTVGLETSDTKVYEPEYEPSSEPLHISAKQLSLNRELYLLVKLSVHELSAPGQQQYATGVPRR